MVKTFSHPQTKGNETKKMGWCFVKS